MIWSSGESHPIVLTIGHSTRPIEEFLELMRARCVAVIADVRTVPRSRHNPQFNRDRLPELLAPHGIAYIHLGGLGGLRRPRGENEAVAGWHNVSFRGYAEYMQTPEFEENLQRLAEVAARNRTVILCAELLPWRCHRTLIADALLARGFQVEHVLNADRCQRHTLTPWAVVDGTRVLYPERGRSEVGLSGL